MAEAGSLAAGRADDAGGLAARHAKLSTTLAGQGADTARGGARNGLRPGLNHFDQSLVN